MADHVEESAVAETPAKSKKKKSKVLLVVPIAFAVLAGAIVGAAKFGVIKVPGLTPGKANHATDLYHEPAEMTPLSQEAETQAPPPEPVATAKPNHATPDESAPDRDAGAKKLASIWNNMDPGAIVAIGASYSAPEFARVLSKMDPEIVAEVLSTIPEKKLAAEISRSIEALASQPPQPQSY